MRRRYLRGISVLVILACLSAGGSLAYFTDTDQADNVFTLGSVEITLTEPSWDPELTPVYPGQSLAKDPQVTNTGLSPCFVRMEVNGLDVFGEMGRIDLETDGIPGKLGDGWFAGSDGCYYYSAPLEPGQVTPPLFQSIRIPTGITHGDGETLYSVRVSAQAVQAQGAKPDYTAMTSAEIAAWMQSVLGNP